MLINNFDKIFCINLKRRADRKKRCDEIFRHYGLNVEYISGVDASRLKLPGNIKPGHKGCCLSHRIIFNKIKDTKSLERVLILEDDVEFHANLHDLFSEYYKEVPDNWEMLYFGGNHNGAEKQMISAHVHRLSNTYTTHCYGIKRSIVPKLLDEFTDEKIYNLEVDVHLSVIQKHNPCYGLFPHLAWQRDSFSDIEMKNKSYDFLR